MDAPGARGGRARGSLKKRPAPGAACRLSDEQQAQILTWLTAGAEAHGFGGCFAYALAAELDEPLLFVGTDFAKTDIAVAVY